MVCDGTELAAPAASKPRTVATKEALPTLAKLASKDSPQATRELARLCIEKGMPNFDGSKMVTENLDGLYGYLKGRADGAIQPGRLEELK
jgi:hypothetical protein